MGCIFIFLIFFFRLPTWGGLLERLGKESGMDEEERETLKNMNFLDQV